VATESPDPEGRRDLSPVTTLTLSTQVYAIRAIGRLRRGVSMQKAQAELNLFAAARAKSYPAS